MRRVPHSCWQNACMPPQLPALILVTGPPGAGKTTVARPLAAALALPLVCKDDLKEILFERLGWSDRSWSRRVSDAAYELMFHVAEAELSAGRSLMLEANFRPEAAGRVRRLPPRRVLQVHCSADRATLVERLTARAAHRLRHPGHVDDQTLAEIEDMLTSGSILDLPGPVLTVDTTAGFKEDLDELAGRVAGWLAEVA